MEIEVETTKGVFKLRKPGAGFIMDAYEKSECEWGFRKAVLIKELLPVSIIAHPFSMGVKLKDELRAMDIQDYMKLGEALLSTIEINKDIKTELKK
ncbi:MAG TPA: hypothetical protein ENN45_04315 [Bacteroidetes bacterium]|nr:hypothetical protein [Bacteroidota bacterium]